MWRTRRKRRPSGSTLRRSPTENALERHARFLAFLRASLARPRRGRRAARHRRIPQGLPGAARDDAAARRLHGGTSAAPKFAGRSTTAGRPSADRRDRRRGRARELGIDDLVEGSSGAPYYVGGRVSRPRAARPKIPTDLSQSAGASHLAQYTG